MSSKVETTTLPTRRKTKSETVCRVCAVHETPFRGATVAFDAKAKTFVDCASGLRYRGVTKLLARAFYPNYTYGGGGGKSRRWRRKRDEKSKTQAARPKRRGGLSRGRSVDRQIEKWVRDSMLCCSVCVPSSPARKRRDVPRACKDPLALAVCAKLAEMRLVPVAAQVVVADSRLCIATAVDVVCRNNMGEYILIEIKAGFEQTLRTSTGALLAAPFASLDQSDCPLNQFHLQLLLTSVLFRRTFPDCVNIGWPQIIITNSHGCTVVPLSNWAVQSGARLLSFLL
jgi:hypothetical protein